MLVWLLESGQGLQSGEAWGWGWGPALTYPPQHGVVIVSLQPSMSLEQESSVCTDPELLPGKRPKVVRGFDQGVWLARMAWESSSQI